MPESPSREEMKAAIELAEARTDTKAFVLMIPREARMAAWHWLRWR
jgi:hypothetical protein